jgi:hypothetical protein
MAAGGTSRAVYGTAATGCWGFKMGAKRRGRGDTAESMLSQRQRGGAWFRSESDCRDVAPLIH